MASVRILFVAMVISVCSLASGQDRIYFRDAAPVDASVREIGDDYVLYKAWDNLGGPDFRVSLMRSAADSMFDDSAFGSSGGSDTGLYVASYVLGAAGLASGIPLLVKGNRKLDAIADDYNRRNGYSLGPRHVEKSLTVGQCHSGGVGLAFNF